MRTLRGPLVAVAAGVLAVGLGLGGCTNSSEADDTGGENAAEKAEGSDESQEGDQDEAEPGTELRSGETAVLPLVDLGEQGVFSVTIDIEPGATEDLDELDFDDERADMVPTFVRYTFEKLDGDALERATLTKFRVRQDDGDLALQYVDPRFERCPISTSPAEFAVGDSFESCIVWLTEPGTEVTNVEYHGVEGMPYRNDPVSWSL